MMSITKHSDYAIVILAYFTKNPTDLMSAKGLAHNLQLPYPIVSKLLKILVKSNLLASTQGSQGGYKLKKPADEISIASVIEAVEGPISMTECATGNHSDCHVEGSCSMKPHWILINNVIKSSLEKLPLSSLVQAPVRTEKLYNLSQKPSQL